MYPITVVPGDISSSSPFCYWKTNMRDSAKLVSFLWSGSILLNGAGPTVEEHASCVIAIKNMFSSCLNIKKIELLWLGACLAREMGGSLHLRFSPLGVEDSGSAYFQDYIINSIMKIHYTKIYRLARTYGASVVRQSTDSLNLVKSHIQMQNLFLTSGCVPQRTSTQDLSATMVSYFSTWWWQYQIFVV